jgi:hypothetical protein
LLNNYITLNKNKTIIHPHLDLKIGEELFLPND